MHDAANIAGTASSIVQRFDHDSNVVFAAYPKTDVSSINDSLSGTTTQYDALRRVTLVAADSELDTTTNYLNGFVTQVVDPGGHTTSSRACPPRQRPDGNEWRAINGKLRR